MLNMNRTTPTHTIIKLSKAKDSKRIVRAAREKESYIQVTLIRLSADFSTELFRTGEKVIT